MGWARRWERLDPCEVLMRRQEIQMRPAPLQLTEDPFGAIREQGRLVMTKEESEQIEELLMGWYRWAKTYRPNLGAPRVSAYGRGASDSDVHADGDDIDARIYVEQCKAVETCLNDMSWQARAAVGIHTANKACGNDVYRNPRMTKEQQHEEYQRSKLDLLPRLQRRGILRNVERKELHA
ncbi:hypothetical protein RBI14_15500 [Alcaligenaceae bacterium B3P038]|nr:hypothetical protein [Alcaligenaceae bacterium B3P038]